MNRPDQHSSRPLGPDAAYDLVVELEHLGLETDRITLDTPLPISTARTGRVDQAALRRPLRRVAGGLMVGAVIGLIHGLVAVLLTDAGLAPSLAVGSMLGIVIGGLVGLYWRLPMSTEVSDVDTGGPSVVTVDLEDLDDAAAKRAIDRLVRA
jgi:hypothetical protein